jgi:DNA-binding response OmpR family regulator
MADGVATALELAARQPFDLLISDLGLSDSSGCRNRLGNHG